ncbi:hypothetical protein GY45DRAFT_1340503 [Cubamyces sp. BRFM 1775]|nr:hypothetical protein GY45DRAFT_1340503 [Cubamyces sp. BRFM 1775]
MSQYFEAFPTTLTLPQARAVRDVLQGCAACNGMCSRPRFDAIGHLRYQHSHRIDEHVVCVALRRLRDSMSYYVCVIESSSMQSNGVLVPFGHYPVPRMSGGLASIAEDERE